MTSIFDEIKDRLSIVDAIARYGVQLEPAGKNYKALCPFHTEKTPSFLVFPETETWRCFGACDTGGDVFDFVVRREGIELREALEQLARQAGVELPHWRGNDEKAIQGQFLVEKVLAVAAEFLAENMDDPSEGLTYARSRGWSAEIIQSAGLGYFGRDWHGLRITLFEAGIHPECPPAVALLGFRGDVKAWAARWEVDAPHVWLDERRVPAMPPDLLIYPHMRRGRIVYLAGRRVNPSEGEPKQWNPPQVLIGSRQLYFNPAYQREAKEVVIVEGQGDGVTLGQWGAPSIALAGCSIGNAETSQNDFLVSVLKRHDAVYLGLDTDAAGKSSTPKLADALIQSGLPVTRIRLITWPAHDANDWLKAGATERDLQHLMQVAPHWLDELTRQAADEALNDTERDPAIRKVFAALAGLEPMHIARRRMSLARQLGLGAETFDAMLRAARKETGADQHSQPTYEVIGGQICHRVHDRFGAETVLPLCNFDARIKADIIEDDGEQQERRFLIEGSLADGHLLPPVEVAATELADMKWALQKWGSKVVVSAGRSTRDHLRAAIQTLSTDTPTRHEYSHLGWRVVNGQRVYLSTAGAVGLEGVQVSVPNALSAYRLPIMPRDLPEAVAASLRFLDTGDCHATIPLWAAMYLAPLSSILPPSFTLWFFGTTGSLKSTATALALCHYGQFAYNTAPASWTATSNFLERMAFTTKDSVLWIDDFTSQSTLTGQQDIIRKADQLLRDWGNRSGRGRMRSDLKLRQTFAPRGLILSTAEQLPPGQSIAARLVEVEISPGMMTHGEGSPLTQAQLNDAPLYPHATAGYLLWLAERYAILEQTLPEKRLAYIERARRAAASEHLRMPSNSAMMFIGLDMGLEFATSVGAIRLSDADTLREYGWSIFLSIGEQQQQVVRKDQDPVEMFLNAIEQMMAQGIAFVRHRGTPHSDVDERGVVTAQPSPSVRMPNATFLGWYDDPHWYFIPGAAFGAVWSYFRQRGIVFPDTEYGVKTKLKERKLLLPDDDRFTYRLRLGDDRPRVLRILRMTADEDSGLSATAGTTGTAGADEPGRGAADRHVASEGPTVPTFEREVPAT